MLNTIATFYNSSFSSLLKVDRVVCIMNAFTIELLVHEKYPSPFLNRIYEVPD